MDYVNRSYEVASDTLEIQIKDQRERWIRYIESVELMLKKLGQPFLCKSMYDVSELRNANNEISGYKFKIDLDSDDVYEYDVLEEELTKYGINDKFNTDGTISLRLFDIEEGLDAAIREKFSETFEREWEIGCILKIDPSSIIHIISRKIPYGKLILNNNLIYVHELTVKPSVINPIFKEYGYELSKISINFKINGIDNLYRTELNKKYSISFGRKASYKNNEKENILPPPINGNTFRIVKPVSPVSNNKAIYSCMDDDPSNSQLTTGSIEDIPLFMMTLCRIYGKENVEPGNVAYIYEPISKDQDSVIKPTSFPEFWPVIRKELWKADFDISVNEWENTIYFNFYDKQDLIEKYSFIEGLKMFYIKKSPLDDDFKFKVRTTLISKKEKKRHFKERIAKLGGCSFVCKYTRSGTELARPVYLGKLSAFESSLNKLVFYVPNVLADEKKLASSFLRFIETKPDIRYIQPHLVGDEAQAKWLREAMDKISDEKLCLNKPNSRPVNPKLKDFIFDSSKAEPIGKFAFSPIEETDQYKLFVKTALFKLNISQQKAVIKALHANDLSLIQGPPGTGKTTIIAEIIWQHIRLNQRCRVLITSETNLAVDNALNVLMNANGENTANSELVRYLTLIKPLRFGHVKVFEEEGKIYSNKRIQRWVEEEVEVEEQKVAEYESEQLVANGDDIDEDINENLSKNAVQQWMTRIAERSRINNEKHSKVLKEWVCELLEPSKETKRYYKNKYYKYANVIGSTCNSTGSPAFQQDYQITFNQHLSGEAHKKIFDILHLLREQPDSRKIQLLTEELKIAIGHTAVDDTNISEFTLNDYTEIVFDTVIVDEASKATPPELLIPLCFGKKAIITGDYRQLPPLLTLQEVMRVLHEMDSSVKVDYESENEYEDTSQFKRLILNPRVHHTIKSICNIQYRMHPHINNVISQFYSNDECGGLVCGLDKDKVDSSDLNEPQSRYHGFYNECLIDTNTHTIWVDVDEPERLDGTSRVNDSEVEAIKRVLLYLKYSDGFNEYMEYWDKIEDEVQRQQEKEIGIISFYSRQVTMLRDAKNLAKKLGIGVRIKTVDKFQGMERNIVIVSMVRSNKIIKGKDSIAPNNDIGFAIEPERLNVALSRARRLLIVVGNKKFFSSFKDKDGNAMYKNVINEIARNGRVVDYKALTKYI